MADIATVIRKTIDGLPVNSPAIRQKVYERARSAILSKLEGRDPRPAQEAIDKQMAVVDKMISAVEEDYSFREQVDTVFAEAAAPAAPAAAVAAAAEAPAMPVPPHPEPVLSAPVPASFPPASEPTLDDVFRETASVSAPNQASSSPTPAAPEPQAEQVPAPSASEPVAPVLPRKIEPARAKSRTGLAASLVLLLLAGGGAYAAWLNKDMLGEKFAALTATESPASAPAKPAAEPAPAAAKPATAPAAKPAEEPATKFTQRLNTDGSETDTGTPTKVAGGLEEGKSVAQATQPSAPAEPAAPVEPAAQPVVPTAEPTASTTEPAAPATPQPAQPAIAVGQRAIFYEERTAAEQGTADQGNVVWAQVEESPGGDKPAEPAVRGTITFPERDLSLRLTIRRNGDATLPASHIIEMVFLPPENFPAGSFDDVLRITFKGSEQAPGTPLLGIPAKIADNFFLVALTDGKAEIETNEKLLATEQWIDIPVIYRTGRRALITMEKGLSGEKVFKDVVAAWQTNPLVQ